MQPEIKALNGDPPSVTPNKPTMLVVDDEEGPRESVKVLFRDQFNVLLAGDGPTGVALAQAYPIDVAVLDIRMAGMSGLEVLERLKFVDPGIEVVMMTAFETADTVRQALRLRACDYINKPFEIAAIRKAVAKAMEHRSLASETRTNIEKLEALQSELEDQKLEGEIYASVIHDINNPLTIISGTVQTINDRIADAKLVSGDDLEIVKDRLKRITRQMSKCIEISRRYLESMTKEDDDTARVNVNEVLSELMETLRIHAGARGHQVSVQPLRENAVARIHGTDLLQILTNLSLNALQCSPQPHKVQVTGRMIKEVVSPDPLNQGAYDRFLNREGFANEPPLIALSVNDTGPGIPSALMDRIFRRGFTTKASQSGSGLGLSIVQRLVKRARGGLHLHSEPGKGTTFTIYLRSR